jgi:hypothetical protein
MRREFIVIRTSATRLQRARRLAGVLLTSVLASACAKPTAQPKPQAQERTAARPRPEAAPPCGHAAKDETLETPDAAVRLYFESVAANDLAGALRAYAANERAAKFDFTSYMRWVIQFTGNIQAPTEYPMFVEINQLRAKGELAAATRAFVYELLADRDPSASQPVTSDAEIEAFVKAVNPARLASLKLVRVDEPRMAASPEALASFKRQSGLNGADEMAERIALYELSGKPFWWGFQLSRYGKTWKIFEHSELARTSSGRNVHRGACSSKPRTRANPAKSLSVVRIASFRRMLTAQIRKSVFDPWSPFARHRLKHVAASS